MGVERVPREGVGGYLRIKLKTGWDDLSSFYLEDSLIRFTEDSLEDLLIRILGLFYIEKLLLLLI